MDLEVARTLADMVSVDAAVVMDGRILYANPTLKERAWEWKGWKHAEDQFLWELFEEDQMEDVRDWYEELRRRDDRFGILVLRRRPEDAPREGETIYALRFEDRELVVVRSSESRPVMERFTELETMVRMFKSYLKDGGLGLMILQNEGDREAVIKYMSPEGAKFLERDVEELIGTLGADILYGKDREEALHRYRNRMSGKQVDPIQKVRMRTPEDQVLMMEVVVGSTTWHGRPAAYCLFKDETSQHVITEELRRFAQGFEIIKDTLVLTDKDFNILYINPTGLDRSGYSLEEVLGRPAFMLSRTQPDEPEPMELIQELFKQGYWQGERMAVSKDGRQYPVELSIGMSVDSKGEPEMMAIHSRDITERKEGERAILRARERAEFFTDLLAHDINNYIQGVLGFQDLLDRTELSDEQRGYMARAHEQADRVAKLISRVRAISKAEHAEELGPVDLNIVVDEALGDIKQRYKDRPFEVDLVGSEGEAIIIADELLRDLVMNVLDNAVKYNDDEVPKVFVSIDRFRRGNVHRVRMEVADNGPGILDEDKKDVFYRFVRRVDDEGGTGLGLSLVWALTERYRGRVWIEDRVPGEPGQGAKVVVEFPAQ